jgi:hypothetical protein
MDITVRTGEGQEVEFNSQIVPHSFNDACLVVAKIELLRCAVEELREALVRYRERLGAESFERPFLDRVLAELRK